MITERRVPLVFNKTAEAVHIETLSMGMLARVAVSVYPDGDRGAFITNRRGCGESAEVTQFKVRASLTIVHYGSNAHVYEHSQEFEHMPWLEREISILHPAHIDDYQVQAFVEGRGKYMPGYPRHLKMVRDFVEARKADPELQLSRKWSIRLPKELIVRIVRPDPPAKPEE